MSTKESRRVYVMEQVLVGQISIREAATLLDLSERHIKRLKGGMKQYGVAYLAHKNRGRKPTHAIPEKTRQTVIELATNLYKGTSCQHMAELLAQYKDLHISAKSVSRILKAANITLSFGHKSARRRRSRARMPQEGLLVQIDASPYDWLDDRGPYLHLHGAIDDATGKLLGLYFLPQEQTLGYLHVLKQLLLNHGVPNSIYSDRHTLFFSPKIDKLSIEQELNGETVPLTQFGRAINQLGIVHIPAYSPQAKGRVERLWGTLQSRLTVELRIAGISTLEEANQFLPSFIKRYNDRFAVEPADPNPAFKLCLSDHDLLPILAFHHSRKASRGSTISFHGRTYQLVGNDGAAKALPSRAPITVLECIDGNLRALFNGEAYKLRLHLTPISTPEKNIESSPKARTPHKPSANHPWRQYSKFQRPTTQDVQHLASRG